MPKAEKDEPQLPRKALRDLDSGDLRAVVLRNQPIIATYGRPTDEGYAWEAVLVRFPESCQTEADKARFLEELKRIAAEP